MNSVCRRRSCSSIAWAIRLGQQLHTQITYFHKIAYKYSSAAGSKKRLSYKFRCSRVAFYRPIITAIFLYNKKKI